MRLSDYIKVLQDLQNQHGDLEVFESSNSTVLGGCRPALVPRIKEIAKLTARETQVRVLVGSECVNDDRRTGRMVVFTR